MEGCAGNSLHWRHSQRGTDTLQSVRTGTQEVHVVQDADGSVQLVIADFGAQFTDAVDQSAALQPGSSLFKPPLHLLHFCCLPSEVVRPCRRRRGSLRGCQEVAAAATAPEVSKRNWPKAVASQHEELPPLESRQCLIKPALVVKNPQLSLVKNLHCSISPVQADIWGETKQLKMLPYPERLPLSPQVLTAFVFHSLLRPGEQSSMKKNHRCLSAELWQSFSSSQHVLEKQVCSRLFFYFFCRSVKFTWKTSTRKCQVFKIWSAKSKLNHSILTWWH